MTEADSMTIGELLTAINERCSGLKKITKDNFENLAKDIIEFTKVIIPGDINMTYEHLSCLKTHPRFRMVLFNRRLSGDVWCELAQYANGLIIQVEFDVSTTPASARARYLVIPSADFSQGTASINAVDADTKIYRIQDGTTINMYYDTYENDWIIATRRSFDMRNTEWRGLTYSQAFYEVAPGIKETLDKTKCYTLGFRHPVYHPFKPSLEMWWIQSVNLSTRETDQSINTQIVVPQEQYDVIQPICQGALEAYLANPADQPILGFIIRTKTKSYLMESSLMTQIKNLVYNSSSSTHTNNKNNKQVAQLFKNMDYVILENYLDFRRRDIFINLFPQFSPNFETLEQILRETTEKIGQLIKRKSEIVTSGAIQKSKLQLKFPMETKSDKLTHAFYPIVSDLTTSQDIKVIGDIITQPRYTEKIYTILTQK